MPVFVVDVAEQVSVPAPLHLEDEAPLVNNGVPTVGTMVTVLVTWAEGPLHPNALTLIVTEPENPVVQVITPDEFIDPAEGLLTVHVNPVLSVAVVE